MPTPPWSTNEDFSNNRKVFWNISFKQIYKATYKYIVQYVNAHTDNIYDALSITNLQEDFELGDIPAIFFVKRFWS